MMRIDPTIPQRPEQIAPQQQTREVPGEREPDGDSDDSLRTASKVQPANQLQDTRVGSRINILA